MLSIIIVNWNVRPLLEKCLFSILKNTQGLDYEIIVVDNNSTDGSREFLSQFRVSGLRFKVILNSQNNGFAKANNQGIKRTRGEFILLLNPDTEVYQGTLQKTVSFMQKNSDCGILGCQLVGSDDVIQPSVRSFPTVGSHLMIFLKLQYLFPRAKVLRDYFQSDFDYYQLAEVDQVMGAFFMTRREVLDRIGLLDERFFLWFEEVDFCKRVKDAGWKIIYNPETRILHRDSRSFSQLLPLCKQRIYTQSAIYYFKKYSSHKEYLILAFLRPLSLLLACFTQILFCFSPMKYEAIKKNKPAFTNIVKYR